MAGHADHGLLPKHEKEESLWLVGKPKVMGKFIL